MNVKITGLIRGLNAENSPEGNEDEQVTMNNRHDLAIAQSLPPYTEIVRLGHSWMSKTTTAFAALTTEPTTVAALTLFNGYAGGGYSIIIDSIFYWQRVTDATQQDYPALFHMLNATNDAAPSSGTQLASTTVKSLSGRAAYDGKSVVRVGATVTDNGWSSVGNPSAFATAFAGALWRTGDVEVAGRYIVPPGSAYSVHMVELAAAASQLQIGIRFHEAQLLVLP